MANTFEGSINQIGNAMQNLGNMSPAQEFDFFNEFIAKSDEMTAVYQKNGGLTQETMIAVAQAEEMSFKARLGIKQALLIAENEQLKAETAFMTANINKVQTEADLEAVRELLFGDDKKYNIIFSPHMLPSDQMNLLYLQITSF